MRGSLAGQVQIKVQAKPLNLSNLLQASGIWNLNLDKQHCCIGDFSDVLLSRARNRKRHVYSILPSRRLLLALH